MGSMGGQDEHDGVLIKVKFRQIGQLQVPTAHHQSRRDPHSTLLSSPPLPPFSRRKMCLLLFSRRKMQTLPENVGLHRKTLDSTTLIFTPPQPTIHVLTNSLSIVTISGEISGYHRLISTI
ncbi:unnamed protein product [Lactuca virosa]|uniref:Uncharacterized protein n=1 Tax=Lactuca virosa TaxID=75947 RepID=A0AAU9P0E8_9ASTR|nr:unnamed protein product [Lactuca virosa]